ncbi:MULTISPECIES: four-helix bundle copper-binding protein [Paenibacillus]|uniref:four-helix bundle copper-binding protein n=1 Tax=Paenibacillus TaxID=44249 RepID=UPI00020D7DAD|nr:MULTISPECIES: four-helix bundle copper-binding protein [Paenibacillus]EGL16631.1 hypothetical protein HMPREF9413_2971 [Paenibacillus sp. HGF7]EPD91983.1 hypothetical protein HMPREF1207_00649 [Paenibacillus sp. HGH0039]MBV6713005.1 four-helix bundle copper-binding protein [Paenibacillus chitinolyticus]
MPYDMTHEGVNEEIQRCIEECINCIKTCNYCFDACLKEDHASHMAACIRLTRECADICTYAASAMTRQSPFIVEICNLCATVCEICAKECAEHEHEHCQECAKVCRSCAEACRRMAA